MINNELETNKRPRSLPKGGIFTDVFKTFNKTEVTECVFLFLLSRICFMGYLVSPFGPALFTAIFSKNKKLSYPLFSIIGILSLGYGAFTFKYCGIILIIAAITTIFSSELKNKLFAPFVICAGSVFLNGMVYVITEGFFAYDILLLILECGASFLSCFAFGKASALIKTLPKRKVLEQSETVSLVILLGAAVLSISLMENLLPVAHVLSITAILILSISCGFSISCPAGVVFGLCLGISSVYQAQTVCIYCLSSLASGFAKKYGKLGTAAAFSIASLVATLLICPESNGIITVSYVALAAVILLFIPDKFINRFGNLRLRARQEFSMTTRIRDAVNDKMDETIESVDSISVVFHDVLESLLAQGGETHGVIFDNTADAVCKKCSLCNYCWLKNREDTLKLMNDMYKTMERKNVLGKADIPQDFSEKCIKSDMFVSELNKNYEAFKITKMWAGRVMESKRLVAEQFNNISMILKNLRSGIVEKMSCEPELENKISAALDRRGIYADKISVSSGDGFSVTMDKVSCGENLVCSTTVAGALTEVLEVPMLRENRECREDICHLKFSQQTRFVTDIAVSFKPCANSSGSGDSVLYFPCGNGKIAIILSDGMGTGEKANFQSNITTQLAKKLLTSGFDKETSVRLINNILMMNADRDTFATIDLCIVNLYKGTMEFIKNGAANSYIKTNTNSETIYASSLPAGLISAVEPDIDMRYMKSGDYLVMVSDGISDILDTPDCNEILNIADGFKGAAKELSDLILEEALSRSGGIATDDLTVVVCAISENM